MRWLWWDEQRLLVVLGLVMTDAAVAVGEFAMSTGWCDALVGASVLLQLHVSVSVPSHLRRRCRVGWPQCASEASRAPAIKVPSGINTWVCTSCSVVNHQRAQRMTSARESSHEWTQTRELQA